jgi:hypothetical protein
VLSDIVARVQQPQINPLVAGDPQKLGGYEIRGRIGSGGMGAVYLGATPNGRALAIKVIRPERVGEHEFRARFRREVAAATRVRSRQTAAVIDYDVEAPTPWLATEYVPGPTLAQVVAEVGVLPEPAVRELVVGVARALDAIHAEGLIHRDVKPANILIGPAGPILLDLGIVADPEGTSLTTTGLQVGTPQYMSPEQALGEQVSAATDVWSLGAAAYVAATGRPPFGTGASAAVGMRVVNEQPHLEALPAGLRGLVGACLAKDPAARPTTPALLAAAIQPVGGVDLPMTRPPQPTYSDPPAAATELRAVDVAQPMPTTMLDHEDDAVRPPGRKRMVLLAGLVAAGLVLVVGGFTAAAAWWPNDDTPVVARPSASRSPAVPSSSADTAQPTTADAPATPTCEITFERKEAVERWSGYCHVNQDPDASYQWCWYDLTAQRVIGKTECSKREMSYIYSYRREHDIRVKVVATRDGYHPSEYVTTTQVPKWW